MLDLHSTRLRIFSKVRGSWDCCGSEFTAESSQFAYVFCRVHLPAVYRPKRTKDRRRGRQLACDQPSTVALR